LIKSDETEVAKLLLAYRRETGAKQAAVAEQLGISQAHYSRIETGAQQPSFHLHARIMRLLEDVRFQYSFDRWRLTVRMSPTLVSLIRGKGNHVELIEFSKGFRALGGNYALVEPGDRLDGVLGEDADHHFQRLQQVGAFNGEVLLVENTWRSSTLQGETFYQAVSTAIPDDQGGTALHSPHRPVKQHVYEEILRDVGNFRILMR
jgi:DNA-binding XRE family transcriptional regulator